jgi:thiosulfate/3-mercaptopyruvate sulfurtransferase
MKKTRYIFSLAISFLFIGTLFSQNLISVNELAKKMSDPNVIVVSAQKPDKYAATHIKGSINMPPAELTINEPTEYILDTPANIAKKLGAAGISDKAEIIVYDEGSSKYSGRLYWTLVYMGAQNVKILNGEITAWKAGRKPITKTPTQGTPTTFAANVQPQYIAMLAEVQEATTASSYVIIDCRTPEEYNGTNEETELRKGHIPGAININYTEVLTSKGTLKSKEELKKLYEAKGVTPDKTVIVYCASSVRASIEFFALTSILNYPSVKVYDGAFNEWEADASNKVLL